ncbi:hypothetical protein BV20DRAFT_966637 [Pilatotrama ljubarskyi]|nr:hypothetical protein BV20DRAFT_966637 [Pilatotrama ljubarskyi]
MAARTMPRGPSSSQGEARRSSSIGHAEATTLCSVPAMLAAHPEPDAVRGGGRRQRANPASPPDKSAKAGSCARRPSASANVDHLDANPAALRPRQPVRGYHLQRPGEAANSCPSLWYSSARSGNTAIMLSRWHTISDL